MQIQQRKMIAGAFHVKRDMDDFDAKRTLDVGFTKATPEEMRKQLNVADLSSMPEGFIAGWASTGDIDHGGDKVATGAFDKAIAEKGIKGPKGIKLLAQHRSDQPAGVITKLEAVGDKLWIEAEMNLKISYVRDLYEAAKMNGGLSFSIGYRLVEGGFKFVEAGEDSHWLLTELDLHEVSVVTFPMNEEATMNYIKGITDEIAFDTVAEFTKALVDSGFAKSRRDADRLVRVIKRNTPLFVAPPEEPPVLASDTKAIEGLSAGIAELKALLSPSS